MKTFFINRVNILSISFLLAVFDQISKQIAIKELTKIKIINFIPNLIQFRLVRNTGAAFSILSNSTFLLSLISLLATAVIILYIINQKRFELLKGLSISLLLGGTIGNGIDRWFNGYVFDFIEILPINFPIFNFADISINMAVLCLLIDIFQNRARETNA
tara:strand:- start:100 stop:579 length:480 start_codon:yes stop_codon:yes gene_type:complete